ncbi:hypothetical protein AVEN_159698-1 [Araneus ventricosus]|uniref:Uncharacterized protein n=1 Tax=Araneus ventricosus TaxID=182803 RepID=A0A4Y2M449_ARAVE|nr:hypothetical protein AVEN_159698-1 [Araneus ventricosus]
MTRLRTMNMTMIGSSVDYVRSGGMRNVPVTKAVEHLYATTAKFSGCVILASRTAYSYPPRRTLLGVWKSARRGEGGADIVVWKGSIPPRGITALSGVTFLLGLLELGPTSPPQQPTPPTHPLDLESTRMDGEESNPAPRRPQSTSAVARNSIY